MTIDISTLIAILATLASIFFGYKAFSRNKTQDDKTDATQLTTISIKLDNIDSTVRDIKADFKSTRADMQDARERILLLEQEYKNLNTNVIKLEKTLECNNIVCSVSKEELPYG